MTTEEEARAVDQVVDRLAARFPDVSRDRVAAIVGEEHLELEGNPIRDFVPVLVEHEARERLRGEGATPTSIVPADASGTGVGPRAGEVSAESTFGAPIGLLNGDPGGNPPQS
jgi:hypothetical protein